MPTTFPPSFVIKQPERAVTLGPRSLIPTSRSVCRQPTGSDSTVVAPACSVRGLLRTLSKMAFNLTPDDLSVNPASKSAAHGITAFPCDLPSQEELREWLPNLQSRIDAMGLSAYMRGSDPPHVLQYNSQRSGSDPGIVCGCWRRPQGEARRFTCDVRTRQRDKTRNEDRMVARPTIEGSLGHPRVDATHSCITV